MADHNTKMVTLRSSDEVEFEVSAAVASKSNVIRLLIEDEDYVQNIIPIYNVDSKTLSKVIKYCAMHDDHQEGDHRRRLDLKQRDAEFIDVVDLDTLYHLLNAANYLDVRGLLDLACEKAAALISGKPPEAIRELFNIKNDYTREEEAEVRRECEWAYQDLN